MGDLHRSCSVVVGLLIRAYWWIDLSTMEWPQNPRTQSERDRGVWEEENEDTDTQKDLIHSISSSHPFVPLPFNSLFWPIYITFSMYTSLPFTLQMHNPFNFRIYAWDLVARWNPEEKKNPPDAQISCITIVVVNHSFQWMSGGALSLSLFLDALIKIIDWESIT